MELMIRITQFLMLQSLCRWFSIEKMPFKFVEWSTKSNDL